MKVHPVAVDRSAMKPEFSLDSRVIDSNGGGTGIEQRHGDAAGAPPDLKHPFGAGSPGAVPILPPVGEPDGDGVGYLEGQ